MIGLTAAVSQMPLFGFEHSFPESPVLQLWCVQDVCGRLREVVTGFFARSAMWWILSQRPGRCLRHSGMGVEVSASHMAPPHPASMAPAMSERALSPIMIQCAGVCLGCMFCMAEKFRIGFVASDIIAEYYWRKQPVQTSRLEFAVLYLAESVAYYSCPKPACLDGGDCLGGAVYQSRAVAKQLQVFAIKLARQFFGFLAVHARTYQRLGETLWPGECCGRSPCCRTFPRVFCLCCDSSQSQPWSPEAPKALLTMRLVLLYISVRAMVLLPLMSHMVSSRSNHTIGFSIPIKVGSVILCCRCRRRLSDVILPDARLWAGFLLFFASVGRSDAVVSFQYCSLACEPVRALPVPLCRCGGCRVL